MFWLLSPKDLVPSFEQINIRELKQWRRRRQGRRLAKKMDLILHSTFVSNAPINVKPAGRGGWGGGWRGIGREFNRSLWPGGRGFELSCCPGVRDIWIFVRVRDHKSFPRVGNSVIFDLTFLPGGRKFDSNFLENVKIPPYAPPLPPPHPPCRFDIDRCITNPVQSANLSKNLLKLNM